MDSSPENYKEALDAAQRAVQIDPNLMEAHRALGYVWERTATYDRGHAVVRNGAAHQP